MNLTKYILILIISGIILLPARSHAQCEVPDSVIISNINTEKLDTLDFDIIIKRRQPCWERFANATLEFRFTDTSFNYKTCKIFDISDMDTYQKLPLATSAGLTLPTDGYLVSVTDTLRKRFCVKVAGPFSYDKCEYIPQNTDIGDSSYRLRRFRITLNDSLTRDPKRKKSLPDTLEWMQPFIYYQAFAYKISQDSLIADSNNVKRTLYYYSDTAANNVEIQTYNKARPDTIIYTTSYASPFQTKVYNFLPEYVGEKKIKISWFSRQEYKNKLFILSRKKSNIGGVDCSTLDYNDTGYVPVIALGMGTKLPDPVLGYAHKYDGIFDNDVDRGRRYCYKLERVSYSNDTTYEDCGCVKVFRNMIDSAKVTPNPTTDGRIYIQYSLYEPGYVTIIIYDLKGRALSIIEDNKYSSKGLHTKEYVFNPTISQGMYNVIVTARLAQADEDQLENGETIIKVMYLQK